MSPKGDETASVVTYLGDNNLRGGTVEATETGDQYKLHSVSELNDLPEPHWLIDGLFRFGSLIGVYGPSGDGKSFLVLDWALSIANGAQWFDRDVNQGVVIYVAAEGARSIRKRVNAWMEHHGVEDLSRAFFLLESVQLRDVKDLKKLARGVRTRARKPVLIVIDTLARCFVGGDENSAKEMGQFVAGLAWLQQEFGAAVMVVHHTGKKEKAQERGSGALRAAADVMIKVSKKQRVLVTVANNKQKDDEEFPSINLRLQEHLLASDETTSCVLVSTEASEDSVGLAPHLLKTLRALASFENQPVSRRDWSKKVGALRTADNHREQLVDRAYVEQTARGMFQITPKGIETAGTVKPKLGGFARKVTGAIH
jgi:hypothetical protein